MTAHFLANAKAYVALVGTLVGTVCTALLGVCAADSDVGKVLTVASVVASALVTAAATWKVQNVDTRTWA